MERLTLQWKVHTAFVDGLKFFLVVMMVAHIIGCVFYMIPTMFRCEGEHDQFPAASSGIEPWWDHWYIPRTNGTKFENWHGVECTDRIRNAVPKHCTCDSTKACIINSAEDWARYSGDSCMPSSWRTVYGLEDRDANGDIVMSVTRRYIDAMYWSLTTMTTIGYGDRGPNNQTEILFVLFAEVLGLSFFALLLQQITTVNDVMGLESRKKSDVKNDIILFMKYPGHPSSLRAHLCLSQLRHFSSIWWVYFLIRVLVHTVSDVG